MCARVVYAFLAGVAAYILVTAIAFARLVWWQAALVSIGFFALEVALGRYLVKRTLRRVGGLVQTALDVRGRVLKGSTVDVHSVHAPAGGLQAYAGPGVAAGSRSGQTYTVEFTLFPPDLSTQWETAGLAFVPEGTPAPMLFGDTHTSGVEVDDIRVVEGDAETPDTGPVTGARRLQVTLVTPGGVKRLAVRYGLAEFGSIDLTKLTPTTGRDS